MVAFVRPRRGDGPRHADAPRRGVRVDLEGLHSERPGRVKRDQAALRQGRGKYFPITTFRRLIAHTRLTFIFTIKGARGARETVRNGTVGGRSVVWITGNMITKRHLRYCLTLDITALCTARACG